jgi:hypothetical protein
MGVVSLELILFILFIAIPIIGRLTRNKNTSQRPNQPANQRPNQPANQRPNQPANQPTNQPQGQMQTQSDFRKRLEEARQRVLEAERTNQQGEYQQGQYQQGQASQQNRPAQANTATQNTPPRPPLVSVGQALSGNQTPAKQQRPQQDDRLIEGYGMSLEGTSLESTKALTKTASAKSKFSAKNPKTLRVTRKRHKRIVLKVNPNALTQGIIWREIFNDPVSKRPKNKTSRRTSSAQRPQP